MDIKEVQGIKRLLEQKIIELLTQYEKETHTHIKRIDFTASRRLAFNIEQSYYAVDTVTSPIEIQLEVFL